MYYYDHEQFIMLRHENDDNFKIWKETRSIRCHYLYVLFLDNYHHDILTFQGLDRNITTAERTNIYIHDAMIAMIVSQMAEQSQPYKYTNKVLPDTMDLHRQPFKVAFSERRKRVLSP